MQSFSKNHEVREVNAPVALGSSIDDNSDIIDMSGWTSVTFIVCITDSADTAVAALTAEQNDANSDTGMTALSGAVDTATASGADDLNDKFLMVEVVKPQKQYVQAVLTSSVAGIAYGNMIAILRGPISKPRSAHASAAGTPVVAISPDES